MGGTLQDDDRPQHPSEGVVVVAQVDTLNPKHTTQGVANLAREAKLICLQCKRHAGRTNANLAREVNLLARQTPRKTYKCNLGARS